MTSYVLYGAGAVGGVIGGRLSLAGHDVTLVARGEHLARIRADGLVLDTAEGRHAVRARGDRHRRRGRVAPDTVVLLVVKSHQTAAALADLVRHAPAAHRSSARRTASPTSRRPCAGSPTPTRSP